jgi:hypothetical protein
MSHVTKRCWACTGWRTHTGRLHLSGCCSCVPSCVPAVRKQSQVASVTKGLFCSSAPAVCRAPMCRRRIVIPCLRTILTDCTPSHALPYCVANCVRICCCFDVSITTLCSLPAASIQQQGMHHIPTYHTHRAGSEQRRQQHCCCRIKGMPTHRCCTAHHRPAHHPACTAICRPVPPPGSCHLHLLTPACPVPGCGARICRHPWR